MPDKEAPTPDTEIAELKAAGDLGLAEPDLDRVSATVSDALDREYEKESGRGDVPRGAGKWRRRRRFVMATLVAVVVGGAATVGYAALTGSSTASDGIGCYSGDEIGGSATIVGLDGRKATTTCADLWAAGEVVAGTDTAPAPLHACVSSDGEGPIKVLASTDASVCDRLGMVDDPNAGLDLEARRFGEFSSELSNVLEGQEFACVDPVRMRRLVQGLLAEHEMTGWTIRESGEFDQVNRCATLALDSVSRVITMFAGRP